MTATRSKALIDDIAFVWAAAAIVYVIIKPVSLNIVLYPALASVGILSVALIVRHGLIVSRTLIRIAILWLVITSAGSIVGIVKGAPYIPEVLAYLLVVPALFFIMCHSASQRIIRVIFHAGLWHTIIFGAFAILSTMLLQREVDLSALQPLNTFTGLFIRIDSSGVVALTSYALSSFLWWGAIWGSSIAYRARNEILPNYWLRCGAAVIALITAFLSWRRGLIISLALVPIILIIVALLLRSRKRTEALSTSITPPTGAWRKVALGYIACAAITGAVIFTLQPNVTYLVRPPASALAAPQPTVTPTAPNDDAPAPTPAPAPPISEIVRGKASSSDIRENEFQALTTPDSVGEALIGNGVGSAVPRNGKARDVRPFQSELQYNQLFYQHGAIGMVAILAVFVISFRFIRSSYLKNTPYSPALLIAMIGAIALLVGNATNPYIQAPGQYWPVLFPFMIHFAMLRDPRFAPTDAPARRIFGLKVTVTP